MADIVVAEQHKKSGLSQNVGQTKTLINQGIEGFFRSRFINKYTEDMDYV